MEKEILIKLDYEKLVLKAIQECKTGDLTFNKWLKHYGLYCTGKEFNMMAEKTASNILVNTLVLGEALYNANVSRVSKYEKELIETTRKSIGADLFYENLVNQQNKL